MHAPGYCTYRQEYGVQFLILGRLLLGLRQQTERLNYADCGLIPTTASLFALSKLLSVLSQWGSEYTSVSTAAKDAKIQLQNFVKRSL